MSRDESHIPRPQTVEGGLRDHDVRWPHETDAWHSLGGSRISLEGHFSHREHIEKPNLWLIHRFFE